jgi:hypothetical protein
VPLFPNAIVSENEGCRIKLLKASTVMIDKMTGVMTRVVECLKQEGKGGDRVSTVIINLADF